MALRTLADVKRRMVVGAVIHVENFAYPPLSGDREILVVQTTNWCIAFPADHPRAGDRQGSWVDVPRSADCTFEGDSVTFTYPDWDGPFCKFTFPS